MTVNLEFNKFVAISFQTNSLALSTNNYPCATKNAFGLTCLLTLVWSVPFQLFSQAIKWKIPPIYDFAQEFNYGHAVVGKTSKDGDTDLLGLIDEKGKVILPFNYSAITPISDKKFWVSDLLHFSRKYKLINIRSQTISPYKYNRIKEMDMRNSVGYVRPTLDREIIKMAQESQSPVKVQPLIEEMENDNQPSLTREYSILLDENGKELSVPFYENEYMEKINDSLFVIIEKTTRFTMYNLHTGKTVFTNAIQYFASESDKFIVKFDSTYGLVNLQGEIEKTYYFERMEGFHEGKAKVAAKAIIKGPFGNYPGILWGFVDSSGKVGLEINNEDVSDFKNGTAKITTHDEYKIIDSNFQVIFSVPKTQTQYLLRTQSGIYSLKKDKKEFVVHVDSGVSEKDQIKMVCEYPVRIDAITINGIVIIDMSTQKYGLLDLNGKMILPTIFDNIMWQYSCKNLLSATYKGKAGYIDLVAYH